MSRPIKFRAWDKNEKLMLLGWNLISDDRGVCEGGWFGALDSPHAPGDDLWASYDLTDIELMQFTGLLDKNGKEIWEGDIVRGSWSDTLAPMFVLYQAPSFVMKQKKIHKSWSTFDVHPDEPQSYEVIGNIYESPELVK